MPTRVTVKATYLGKMKFSGSVRQAVALSDEKFCPVWATLKAAVPVSSTIRIE